MRRDLGEERGNAARVHQVWHQARADIPALLVTGGFRAPVTFRGERLGSGTPLWRYDDARLAGLLSSGQIRLGPLITHRFPLEEFEDAYHALRESDGPRGKVMLDVTEASQA